MCTKICISLCDLCTTVLRHITVVKCDNDCQNLSWILMSHWHEALVSWPANSPNLNPLTFLFLQGYLKTNIYSNGQSQRGTVPWNSTTAGDIEDTPRIYQQLQASSSSCWTAYSWNMKAISSTASKKVKIKGLLITLVFFLHATHYLWSI